MADNTLNTRILLKTGTLSEWQAGKYNKTEYLKKGEVAIVTIGLDVETTHSTDATGTHPILFKVGTGAHYFDALPWASALAADVYDCAKKPNLDVNDLPTLPLTVVDEEDGKFITDVEYANDVITIHRGDVALDDISDKEKIALSADLGNVSTLTTTAKTAVGAINEHDTEIGDLSKLNTENKNSLVNAINEALQAVEVGGTGSVVTVVKEETPTEGSVATYTVKQGGNAVGDKIEVFKTDVATGSTNGTISVNGEDVAVKGLGDAAYTTVDALHQHTEDAIDEYERGRVTPLETTINGKIDAINNETTGILAQAKAYVDEEDKFYNGITTVNALGGIAANTSLDDKTTHEILDMLLFPYVAFSITSSSRTAAAATLENGATQTLSSCSITVAKKSKPITSITLYNGSTVLETKTGDAVANGGTITFNGFNAITVSKSNNPNLKFTVTDGQTSTNRNVGASTFVYPYYWGVCAPDATIDEALVEGLTKSVSSKGNKTDISFTCANQKQVFAYPKSHGVLKSIIDPNNFEIIDGFTRSELSITGLDGTAQNYYVYVSGACTVTDFKIDFKY